MADNKCSVTWCEEGKPRFQMVYLVAIRYPNGFGAYDFAKWTEEGWDLGYTAEVVGWVSSDEIANKLDFGWPAGDEATDDEFYKGMTYEERVEQRRKDSEGSPPTWVKIK